jgi:crotonobetainyl-CoA:carnitine CoA-transferase CaiB-like acyl-CoA transferase
VASFPHRVVGNMTLAGLYFDLSDTPGVIQGPPVWPGENTRSIMRELGYSDEDIDQLIATGAADDTAEILAPAS